MVYKLFAYFIRKYPRKTFTMKKTLKITGITLLALIIILAFVPILFESQIKDMIKKAINDNVNAKVEFSDVNLSLLSSFPKASVSIENLNITNFAPFEDETLVSVKSIEFTMPLGELLNTSGETPMTISSIAIDEALLTLKTNKNGIANYDIAKKDGSESTSKTEENKSSGSKNFTFSIDDYSLKNSAVTYIDETANMNAYVTELNHSGKGTFSADRSEIDTNTSLHVTLEMDSTQYLNNVAFTLDAIIGADLENNIYTFKDNAAQINKMPLKFDGSFGLIDSGQQIDLTFENPGTSFKDFLALLPEAYSKDLNNVQTSGDFKVKGLVKGLVSETTIPTLDITITSENASFKYPDLPKGINNIVINTVIKNESGNPDDTYVDLKALNFNIDKDRFASSAKISNLTKNMLVKAKLNGTINLANISQAYPIQMDQELNGILKGDIYTNFDMDAIDTNAYERIKTTGQLSLTGFHFASEDLLNPVDINDANLSFNTQSVTLNQFKARTGKSDIQAKGNIENLMGFVMSNKPLKGNFTLYSNTFAVSDFMVEESSEKSPQKTSETKLASQTTEPLKIPAFLDCTVNANANTVLYDNLTLKQVAGTLIIKDQKATLNNITSEIFNGKMAMNGSVDTKNDVPDFSFDFDMKGIDIAQSFRDLDLLKALAPIAQTLQGSFNSGIKLSGKLSPEMTPDLNSVNGKAAIELLTSKETLENNKLVSSLGQNLKFLDVSKLDLKDLKTYLTFENGEVAVKPFTIKYEDIDITVSGSHGFNTKLSYIAVLDVPAKYLGSDINRLIGKIDDPKVNNMTVPVTANITGTYTAPKVKTDLSSSVSNLTKQLVEIQKQKMMNKGEEKAKDIINNLLGANSQSSNNNSDTTGTSNNSTQNAVEEGVKNAVNSLFKNSKKE